MKIPGHCRFFRQLIQLFFRSAGQVDENPAVERKRDAFTGGIFPGLRETGSQNRLSPFRRSPILERNSFRASPAVQLPQRLGGDFIRAGRAGARQGGPTAWFFRCFIGGGFGRKNAINPRRNCSGRVLLLTLHTTSNIMPPAAITPPAVAAGRCGRRRWTPVPPAMAGTARESEPRRRPPDCPPAYGCG